MKRILWKATILLMTVLVLTAPAAAQDSKTTAATKNAEAVKTSTTPKQIVAVFRLKGGLSETPTDESFPLLADQSTALKDLVQRMHKAAADKDVKAVTITLSDFGAGFAQIEELRQAIAGLRSAGKDVYAHAGIRALVGGHAALPQWPDASPGKRSGESDTAYFPGYASLCENLQEGRVGGTRLELVTSTMSTWRSNQLS